MRKITRTIKLNIFVSDCLLSLFASSSNLNNKLLFAFYSNLSNMRKIYISIIVVRMRLNKDTFLGAAYLLGLQIIIWIIAWLFVYFNYEQLTKNDSAVEVATVQRKQLNSSSESMHIMQSSDKAALYSGYFGHVMVWEIQTGQSLFNFRSKNLTSIDLDNDAIRTILVLDDLKNRGLIDSYMYDYFKKRWWQHLLAFVSDMHVMGKYVGQENFSIDINAWNKTIHELQQLVEQNKYSTLVKRLDELERDANAYLHDEKSKQYKFVPNFFYDEDFEYVLSTLYGSGSTYKPLVDNFSQQLGINKNFILAGLATEQMRSFYTQRGQLKDVIKKSGLLVVNSQFSLGIWWIKLKTAQQIESDLAQTSPQLYESIFAHDPHNQETRLTKSDSFQIAYPAVMIYNILQKWTKDNIDISLNPWVIMTLYNFGNPSSKQPHPNPEIWGSLLNINWVNYTFGSLWMIIYYLLEFYR